MQQERDINRDWALRLAEAGMAVFPCDANKKPLVKWRQFSSSDTDAVAQWWSQYPNALPGIDLEKCDLVVLDGDRHGGPDGRTALRELLQAQPDYNPPATPRALTPGNGAHVYFCQNGHELTNSRGDLPAGIDVRGAGGYVIAPYTVLPDGRRYQTVPKAPDLISTYKAGTIPPIPEGIVALLEARKSNRVAESGADSGGEPEQAKPGIRERAYAEAALEGCTQELAACAPGKRNELLNALAYRLGRMIACGWLARGRVEADLSGSMQTNGYTDEEGTGAVEATLRSGIDAGMLEPHPDLGEGAAAENEAEVEEKKQPDVEPCGLDTVIRVFDEWLALEDKTPVYATLGAIAANLLPGDPVWLGIIAPPSSAKTELLNACSRLPFVVVAEALTPAALLSGVSKKQQHKKASGGLLRQLGRFGILAFKDFGTVLEMRAEARSEMLSALRRIFDGEYVRQVGTDGGLTLQWRGKIGVIFASTQAYDEHHTVIGTLGDRFLLVRLHSDEDEQFDMCFRHVGAATQTMRENLAAVVAGLFAGLPDPMPKPPVASSEERARLKKTVKLAIRLRAGVIRSRLGREIEAVYDPEGPGRLTLLLERLLAGLSIIGLAREQAMRVVEKVAMDSTPKLRLAAYHALTDEWETTRKIAGVLKMPTTTVKRALEDLAAQRLADRDDNEGGAYSWRRAQSST
jgi:hypothetical protein